MAVKLQVMLQRSEYVIKEVTLSDEEYQKYKQDLREHGVIETGNDLLNHPTAKYHDSFGSSDEVVSIRDLFEDEIYSD